MTSEVRDPLARQQLVYVHVGDLGASVCSECL
jgi:hypothetical protein